MNDPDVKICGTGKAKTFPVDIHSVKEFGISRWQEECSIWPIKDSESLALIADIQELYWQITTNSSPELNGALNALFKLTLEYESLIHSLIVVERIGRSGYSIMHTNKALYYDEILRETNKIRGLFSQYKHKLLPQVPSFWQRSLTKIETFLIGLKFHSNNFGAYFRSIGNSFISSAGYPSSDMRRYLASKGKGIRFRLPFMLLPKKHLLSQNVLREIDWIVHQISDGLQRIAIKYDVHLKTNHLEYLEKITNIHLQAVTVSITEIWRYLRKIKKTSLLFQSLGNTDVRCMCVAGKKAGHQIVGSTHGNEIGIHKGRSFGVIDLSLVDIYVVPTKGSKELFSKVQKNHYLHASREIKFVSINTDRYLKLWQINKKVSRPFSIKSVMVVEYPLTEFRHNNTFAYWPYQLELTLRIGRFLQKKGIKAILKRHPDRLKESEGIYDQYFHELLTEPFERVYEIADAFLFTNITTTTFGFALLTNRPILFFDILLKDIWEELHEPLRKRCRVIPSLIDEDGKLKYDEKAFSNALQKTPEEPDTEFIEEYMFP